MLRRSSKEICYVFVAFDISRDLSKHTCTGAMHACLGSDVRVLVLLTFISNINKQQYLKIYSLKFDKI